MNFQLGSNLMVDVQIPILWGDRAILEDTDGRLSIVDLGGSEAKLEVLGDSPAPNIEYLPTRFGFEIKRSGISLYSYNPKDKLLTSISLNLPQCAITSEGTRVGSSTFTSNLILGAEVGIVVSEGSVSVGGQIPDGLAKLRVPYQVSSEREDVHISEIADESAAIRNRIFEDCAIIGPAIIAPIGHSGFYDCSWQGDAESMFWALPRNGAVGAIVTDNCVFRRCQFRNVGLAARREQLDQMKAGFTSADMSQTPPPGGTNQPEA